MKNLLYIGNKLSKHGNTITSIETLGNCLIAEGYAVTMVSSTQHKLLRLLDMWGAIFKNRKKADYILIDTYSTTNFYFAWSCAKIAKFFKIPYIPILRGGNLPNRLKSHPKMSKSLFDNAKINVAPSNYLKNAFKDFGFDNIVHIPNTIEIEKYPFKLRENVHPKLLWVRSFSEIYNPILALKVLQKLQQEYPEATLCMVGPEKDGSLRDCKDFAQKNKLNVTFTGRLSKADWISTSEDYDMFINTTNFDNTPVSVIEAMALGLPVISTNVGGLPFLIDNSKDGLLVSPDNALQFIEAIEELVQNPSQARGLSINARQKAESFDWQQVKEQWLELLS